MGNSDLIQDSGVFVKHLMMYWSSELSRFPHQSIHQAPVMQGLSHMGTQGVHPGMRPNQILAEQQQAQQQQAQQQQQQYLRQQALRVCIVYLLGLLLAISNTTDQHGTVY